MVGAGHNGLTAAAYLARAGLRVCVLERRAIVGGACVTEEVWPGYRVSRASYVVSMLQPKVVADLPGVVGWAARAAGLPRARIHELVRLMTMSVGDLLDEWFDDDALKGCLASTGVVGVWAGPRTPGTAYNLLHHALGELDGRPGAWGHVRGGMGAISVALARAAQAHGATIRTAAPVAAIDIADGAVRGVTLDGGEALRAPLVVSGAHPQTTILDLAGAAHFPAEVVDDMRRYRSRGASVKVNLVLSQPPRHAGMDAAEQAALLRTGLALCPSIDDLERAWQDAVLGRPASAPYVEIEVPSIVDPTLADGDGCVATLFTQYGPPDAEGWPDGARERYLDACLARLESVAPGVAGSVVHAEVLAPPDLERIFGLRGGSIFNGEQDLAQLAFMRPSPALARYATPVRGLYLCGAGTHPGGGVMAAAGHNAAMRVLHDRRRARLTHSLRRVATVR